MHSIKAKTFPQRKLLLLILNCDYFNWFLFQWHHSIFRFPTTNYPEQTKSREVNDFDETQYWNAHTHAKHTATKCQEISDCVSFNSLIYFYFFECNSYYGLFCAVMRLNSVQMMHCTQVLFCLFIPFVSQNQNCACIKI